MRLVCDGVVNGLGQRYTCTYYLQDAFFKFDEFFPSKHSTVFRRNSGLSTDCFVAGDKTTLLKTFGAILILVWRWYEYAAPAESGVCKASVRKTTAKPSPYMGSRHDLTSHLV